MEIITALIYSVGYFILGFLTGQLVCFTLDCLLKLIGGDFIFDFILGIIILLALGILFGTLTICFFEAIDDIINNR